MTDVRSDASFRDIAGPDGVLWRVTERGVGVFYPGRPSLVFDCGTVVRRLYRYPANWRALSDDELLTLSLTWAR
jgi:hypothetical protein